MLERLRDREQVLSFARDLAVPFTNNQAERDPRPAQTQIKISGCHCSTTGAAPGYASAATCIHRRKHEVNVLAALRDGTPAPHGSQSPHDT